MIVELICTSVTVEHGNVGSREIRVQLVDVDLDELLNIPDVKDALDHQHSDGYKEGLGNGYIKGSDDSYERGYEDGKRDA